VLGAYDRWFGLELEHLAVDGCTTKAPAWGNQSGKLRWCTERHRLVVALWLALANAAIVCGRLSAVPGPAPAGRADRDAVHDRL